jgi:hypothetical protein
MGFGLDGGFGFDGGDIGVDIGSGGIGVGVDNIPDITLPGGITISTPDQISFGLGSNSAEDAAVIVVNRCEYLLKLNVSQYRAGQKSQAAALAFFDQCMAQLNQACAAVGGTWGHNCAADRAPGGKFHWYEDYRTPLVTGPTSGPGSIPIIGNLLTGGSNNMLVIVAILAIIYFETR